MNGIGSAAKRAVRAACYTWDESMARRNAPRDYFKWHALENDSLSPDYFMHVVPERKLIYVEVPKTASSYIIAELVKAFRGSNAEGNLHCRSRSGLKSPRAIGISKFVDLIDDPETFIFTSVRNPYTRLVSCYFDKFSNVAIGDGSYISNTYIAYRRLIGEPAVDGRPLTLEEFVAFACDTAPLRYDGHWCRQSDIVPNWIAKPHFVVRFETLSRDLANVMRRFSVRSDRVQEILSCAVPTTDRKARELLTATMTAKIVEAYSVDFARFGYSTHP